MRNVAFILDYKNSLKLQADCEPFKCSNSQLISLTEVY